MTLKTALDQVFETDGNEVLDDDVINGRMFEIIRRLSSDEAYALIDEAVQYLLNAQDSNVIYHTIQLISSLYGISGTTELTELFEARQSYIDRYVERYGDKACNDALKMLKRDLNIAKI